MTPGHLRTPDTWRAAAEAAAYCLRDHLGVHGLFADCGHEELAACAVRIREGIPPAAVRNALLERLARRGSNGGLPSHPEGRTPPEPSGNGPVALSPCWALTSTLNTYLDRTGDATLLTEACGNRTVLDALLEALDYLWTHQLDAGTGLLRGPAMVDSVDAGSGPDADSLDLYPNLRMDLELTRLLAHLPAEEPRRPGWTARRQALREAVVTHFTRSPDTPFRARIVREDDRLEGIFAPHANILALHMGVTANGQSAAIRKQLVQLLDPAQDPPGGLIPTPAYPDGSGPRILQAGACEHSRSNLESAIRLIRAGYPELAEPLLNRQADRLAADGDFFEWYAPGLGPQGRAHCRDTACLFLEAVELMGAAPSAAPEPPAPAPARTAIRFGLPAGLRGFAIKNRPFRDKRDSHRLPIELPVRIRLPGRFRSRWVEGVIRHPSRVGLCLQTREPIPPLPRLRVVADTTRIGGAGDCRLQGRVVWSHPRACTPFHQCGLELLPRGRHLRHWRDLIMQQLLEHERELN